MGQVACQTIDFGRGVCGTAAATKQTQLVPDVDAFPGHIACDGASKSEIVVPVTVEVVSPEEGGHVEKKVVGISELIVPFRSLDVPFSLCCLGGLQSLSRRQRL